MTKRKVAVLMGGTSAERDVSLSTGRQILDALDDRRYHVSSLDAADTAAVLAALTRTGPTSSSSPCTGRAARTGRSRVCWKFFHVPYTGSGVLASALAMDKAMCKRVLTVGRPYAARRDRAAGRRRRPRRLALPAIVKPNRQGSTIGMSVVRARRRSRRPWNAFEHDDTALVESSSPGPRSPFPCWATPNWKFPIVEIVPASGFYDYQAKYTAGATDEIVPARLPHAVAAEAGASPNSAIGRSAAGACPAPT